MGLLDISEDQLIGGLLGAGAASGARGNFLSRLAAGMGAGEKFSQGRQEQARQRSQDEMQAEYRALMAKKMQMEMEREEAAAAKQKSMTDMAGRFATPALPGMGGFNGSLPPEMQVPSVPGKPASYDFQGYAQALAGVDPKAGFDMLQALKPKESAPISVAPGATLLDPATNKVLFQNPKEPSVPSAIQEYQFAKEQGYPGTYQQWTMDNKKAGATSITNSINTGQKGFDNTLKLRADFRSEPIYKAHQEVQSAYSQIQQGLKMASPAGDLAGATKIMKLLDPGSVVRESELGMAMAATGAMDRLQNYATNIINGTKLSPTQRKDFQSLADRLYGESVKQYNSKRAEYQGIAQRNQLNEADILGPAAAAPGGPEKNITVDY